MNAIRSHDYVNHPYAVVRDALVKDPADMLRAATNSAAVRARDVAAALRVNIGPLDIGAEIAVGIVGGALDAMVGHHIAQASAHRFVTDVAKYLREHVK